MWLRSLARCWLQLENEKGIRSGIALSLGFLPCLSCQTARYSITTQAGAPGRAASGLQASTPTSIPAYTIWGANTGVGKTLASVGLAYAARRNQMHMLYLKPVQTGFPQDSDARLVAAASGSLLEVGDHAAQLVSSRHPSNNHHSQPQQRHCKVLHAWGLATSPHLAVQREGRPVSDTQVTASTLAEIQAYTRGLVSAGGTSGAEALCLVETAGGVASPAPSGQLMCDVLRPLRLPAILVGDPRLGGISATISAYESLVIRGYDVEAVVFFDPSLPLTATAEASSAVTQQVHTSGSSPQPRLGNAAAVQSHLMSQRLHKLGMPPTVVMELPGVLPPGATSSSSSSSSSSSGHAAHHYSDSGEVSELMQAGLDRELSAWLQATSSLFDALTSLLLGRHSQRMSLLNTAAQRSTDCLWWPFTQHKSLEAGAVNVVDSRCGEHWSVYSQQATSTASDQNAAHQQEAGLQPLYDACSSWWTQAATAAAQPDLARTVAYAAGRYLHVLSPQNTHQVGLIAAERLVSVVGGNWASRVFFSDDGSTAIEVALKMAFRKFMVDKGLAGSTDATGASHQGARKPVELQVVGLANAYHGDTLGAADCVAPSVFNARLQAPWYQGRGVFLEPPYLGMVRGTWQLATRPTWLTQDKSGAAAATSATWQDLDQVLASARDDSDLTQDYRQYIDRVLDSHTSAQPPGSHLAALIMEPLVQGAGGMLLVDPQFQRQLVQACRARGLPVIFDEVMTGLYRVGGVTAASLLREEPDIGCYAKLMTAGLVPMAATLASETVFRSFEGNSKMQALLHGHSYTAFPIGCAATVAALDMLTSTQYNPNICTPAGTRPTCPTPDVCSARGTPCGRLVPMWSQDSVSQLSHHPAVAHVMCTGTVLAAQLATQGPKTHPGTQPSQAAGKVSYAAVHCSSVEVARRLKTQHGIYARPLGDVIYLMVPPTASKSTCTWLLKSLLSVLDSMSSPGSVGSGVSAQHSAGDGVVV